MDYLFRSAYKVGQIYAILADESNSRIYIEHIDLTGQ